MLCSVRGCLVVKPEWAENPKVYLDNAVQSLVEQTPDRIRTTVHGTMTKALGWNVENIVIRSSQKSVQILAVVNGRVVESKIVERS